MNKTDRRNVNYGTGQKTVKFFCICIKDGYSSVYVTNFQPSVESRDDVTQTVLTETTTE